ncbi:MAG: hypothetical protein U9Q34_02500, partial [Elusimicrobiota bacterium]|nr:hypothetical protein [Elusimicrobiota bacterium]
MKRYFINIFIIVFGLFFALSPSVYAGNSVKKQKSKLTNIQKQIELKQKELKRYKKKEGSIKKVIKSLRRKERRALSRHRRLNIILSDTRKKRNVETTKYSSLRAASKKWTKALSSEFIFYFFSTQGYSDYFSGGDLIKDISLKAIMNEKVFLIKKAKGDSGKIKSGISKLKKKDRDLLSKRRQIV